jgi:hypothetical protein
MLIRMRIPPDPDAQNYINDVLPYYSRPAFVLGSDGDTTVPVNFLDSIHSKPSLNLTVTRIPSRKTRHQGPQVVLLTKIYDRTPIDD